MTNQEKIQWLKQYKALDKTITRQIEEKERWKSRAMKVTPTWSDMPKGSDEENLRELAICKMMDCERDITKLIDEYANLNKEIKQAINSINDSTLRLLMQLRYIDGKTFEGIAVEMNYTWRWVHKLHSSALDKLDMVIHI